MTVTSGTVYVDTTWSGTESGTQSEPFNTLVEAEAHFSGACDGACVIVCRGGADNTAATINFDTLGYGMTVKTARESDWSGTTNGKYDGTNNYSNSHYRRKTSSTTNVIISSDDVTIDGLQIEGNTSAHLDGIRVSSGQDNVKILRCRFWQNDATFQNSYGQAAIDCTDNTNVVIDSCLFVGWVYGSGSGYAAISMWQPLNSGSSTYTVYNCTFAQCDVPLYLNESTINAELTINVYNCAFWDVGNTVVIENDDTVTLTGYSCLTEGTSSTPSIGTWNTHTESTQADADIFEDVGVWNKTDSMNVADSGSDLNGNGEDAGEADDITDTTNATRDTVGCYHFITAGLGAEEIMLHLLRDRINPIRQM